MFGKCIKEIDDFIQWTKKSYFWHSIIGSNFGFVLYHTIYNLIISGWDETWSFSIYESIPPHISFSGGICCFFIHLLFFSIIMVPFAVIINITAKIIYFILIQANIIKRQPCCITNKFLLYNRWYNIYYITSFVFLSCSALINFTIYIIINA